MKNAETIRGKAKAKAIQPVARREEPWNVLVVVLGTGHTYIVTRKAIEKDYASFLIVQDCHVTPGVAMERARSEDLRFWFDEQYDVDDVRAQGHVVTEPSYEDMQKMLMGAEATLTIDSVKAVLL